MRNFYFLTSGGNFGFCKREMDAEQMDSLGVSTYFDEGMMLDEASDLIADDARQYELVIIESDGVISSPWFLEGDTITDPKTLATFDL